MDFLDVSADSWPFKYCNPSDTQQHVHLHHDDQCIDGRFCDTSTSKNTTLSHSHSRSASSAGHPVPFMDSNQQAMGWNPNLIDGTLPYFPPPSNLQCLSFPHFDYMQDNGNSTPDLVHSSVTNNFANGAESGSERCCSVPGSPCNQSNCQDGWDECDGSSSQCSDAGCTDVGCVDVGCVDRFGAQKAADVLTSLPRRAAQAPYPHLPNQNAVDFLGTIDHWDGAVPSQLTEDGNTQQSRPSENGMGFANDSGPDNVDELARMRQMLQDLASHMARHHTEMNNAAAVLLPCSDDCAYGHINLSQPFPLDQCPVEGHYHADLGDWSIPQPCTFQPGNPRQFLNHVFEAHYMSADNNHSHQPTDFIHSHQPAQPFSKDDPQTHVSDNALKSSSSPVEVLQEYVAETVNHTCRWLDDSKQECGCTFHNDKDLQTHCRDDHIAEMVKRTKEERSGNQDEKAGFPCLWAGCSRVTNFTQKSKLERHLQTHTGYKPVMCPVCNIPLSAKQSLQQHMRIHTGEKPWQCTHKGCSQAFKQQSALTMHMRTHSGLKPLKCDVCGKTFGESSNLSKHKKTHNEKGEHRCNICGKDFHRLDQLRRHNKIHEKHSGSGTAVASSPDENLDRMTQKKPSGVKKSKKI